MYQSINICICICVYIHHESLSLSFNQAAWHVSFPAVRATALSGAAIHRICQDHLAKASQSEWVKYNSYPPVIKHGNGKSPINGPFSIAMFDYQRIYNMSGEYDWSIID